MRRPEQLARAIRDVAGEWIAAQEDFPPDTTVTVTHVALSPRKTRATIFVSTFPDEQFPATYAALARTSGRFQRALAGALGKRVVPRVRFAPDPHIVALAGDLPPVKP